MSEPTCTCGRPASFVRWEYRGGTKRVTCCAFHHVHPDATHPFDLHDDPDWPHAVEAQP